MKKLNNKSGFTLIEIIVVLIIVGILAAIALPNLFQNVAKSRSEEALASISSMRPTVESCIMKAAGVLESTTCTQALMFQGGAPTASANFTYSVTQPANALDTGYTITATGTGALAITDTIVVKRAPAAWASPPVFGTVSCTGSGVLTGAC